MNGWREINKAVTKTCSVKKADLINVYMFVLDDIKKNNKQSNVVLLVVVLVTLQEVSQ